MTRAEWFRRARQLRTGVAQVEKEVKRRQLDDDVTAEEAAVLSDAARHAIGLQRALWRGLDLAQSVDQPTKP